ncbi:hypothetical protein A134_23185 [Vibrio crassostreae 9CS106]|uniref:Uncharacterized protein n=1 Tax=Vibrio crassostreae 9CS106 TaxID=1191300 RepID=A0A1B1C386_9VIBR|nr:hypothetical protein A134_23185 [Vibrio crassostreae 9CS106]
MNRPNEPAAKPRGLFCKENIIMATLGFLCVRAYVQAEDLASVMTQQKNDDKILELTLDNHRAIGSIEAKLDSLLDEFERLRK